MGGPSTFAVLAVCTLLSYASACIQGEKSAVDGDCGAYMECNDKGELVQKKCAFTKKFDAERKECDFYWRVTCYKKPVECKAGKVYPHPDSCRLYYSCVGGHLAVQSCSFIKVFDPATGNCKFGWGCDKVACVASESRVIPGDCSSYELCEKGAWVKHACDPDSHYDPATKSCLKGGCTQCKEGDVRAAKECNHYEECSVGLWFEKKCFIGKRFNPEKKSCVWFFQYTCPKSDMKLPLAGTCRDGDTRAEDDCTKYSICEKGSWNLLSCPEEYKFDSVKLECVAANEARCASCSEDSADEKSCGSYYACDHGKKASKTCGFLKQWDGVTKKCVYWGAHCLPGDACSQEGQKLPTDDCKHYKECISGNYYRMTCGFSRMYDSEKKRCVWVLPWKKCDVKLSMTECSEGETKLLSCERYVKCLEGRWLMEVCKSGESFVGGKCIKGECNVKRKSCRGYSINGVDMECDEGEVFDEQRRECRKGSCGRARRALESCAEGEKVPIDCKRYKECVGGKFVEKACKGCMNFNKINGICNFVWDYPCKGGEPTPQPPTAPTPQPPTAPTTQPPACKEGEKRPDPLNCRRYFFCKKGKFEQDLCYWPMDFDSVDLKCVWWGARCAHK